MARKKTRILLLKYHEAADQQPLSRRAAERLGIYPPLALAQLAAWVRQHGFEVRILDLHAENLLPERAAARVAEYDPDVVGLTAKTLGWPAVLEVAQMARRAAPRALVVVGGPHLSIYARESLTWDCLDVAVVGDGEQTFLELCERVESGSELDGLAGTVLRRPDGEIVENPPRPPAPDLDAFPMPAFDLLPMDRYHCLTVARPFATMTTSRGCPWHCGFCSQVYSELLRFRSPGLVAEEMQWLERRYGVREIVMFDETFTVGRKRMYALSEEIRRRGLRARLDVRARVDTVDREVLGWLKGAGLRSIHMGVEAGSDRMLRVMNKKITVAQVREAFEAARELDIETRGYFIIGYVDCDESDVQDTIALATSLPLDWASFSVATILPATDLYRVARERGYVDGDPWRRWTLDGGGLVPQLETETLSSARLRTLRTRAYASFYLRPAVVRRKLAAVRTPRDLAELAGGGLVLGDILWSAARRRIPRQGPGRRSTV